MAEQIIGPNWTSYEQTVQHILQMEDMIHILTAQDRPWIGGVGGDGVPLLTSRPVLNRIYYWQEEDEPQPEGILAEALDGSETAIDIDNGLAANWRVGDFILVDDEIMKITAIDTSGDPDVLTVERGAGGSSATTHADNAEIRGLGTVVPEGQLGGASYLGRDSLNNVTQIFSGTIGVSRTEQSIPKYGVPSELAKQTAVQLKRVQLEMENAAAYGQFWNNTATRERTTRGYFPSVTTAANIDSTNTWATLKRIEALLQVVHNNGGETDGMCFMAKEQNFGALNNLTDTGRVRVDTIDDARRGRVKARVVMTEFGDVTLARNRRLRNADAALYHPSRFQRRVFQPLILFPLAKTDDTDKFGLVAECGFQLKGADQAAKFTALDSTQTLPTTGLV